MTDTQQDTWGHLMCPHDMPLDQHCIECNTVEAVVTRAMQPASRQLSDDRLDELMQSQGRPSLATLYKQGKSSGLIKPQLDYAHAAA